jgi:hypothetical protein
MFTNDRAGATAMKWPVAIPIDSITTPFPHELSAYNTPVSLVQIHRDHAHAEPPHCLQLTLDNDQTVDDILNGRNNGVTVGTHIRLVVSILSGSRHSSLSNFGELLSVSTPSERVY